MILVKTLYFCLINIKTNMNSQTNQVIKRFSGTMINYLNEMDRIIKEMVATEDLVRQKLKQRAERNKEESKEE